MRKSLQNILGLVETLMSIRFGWQFVPLRRATHVGLLRVTVTSPEFLPRPVPACFNNTAHTTN
jgi:hypothetical protein